MNIKSILGPVLAAGWLGTASLIAQTAGAPAPAEATPTPAPRPELSRLLQQIQGKIDAGQHGEADFAGELKSFDDLIAKEKADRTGGDAEVAYMKGMLYVEVIKDFVRASAIMRSIAADYPNTKYGDGAAKIIADLDRMAASQQIQAGLAVGSAFPDFAVTNLTGKPISVGDYKGKVVLLDFWATWCPPCRAELPTVIALYKKYHAGGFEIIGVNLDSKREDLDAFLADHAGMTWAQYFDGGGWTNALVRKYGVTAIPATILVGPNGKIINKDVHAEELEKAVAEAMVMNSP